MNQDSARTEPAIAHRGADASRWTAALTCSQRLDRARGYVLLMRELRRSAWQPIDGRTTQRPG